MERNSNASGNRTTMRLAFGIAFLSLIGTIGAVAQGASTLVVDTSKSIAKISPHLYGLMTEEINHSYDGGIYAELIKNRTFHTAGSARIADWTILENGNARAAMSLDKTTGPSTALSQSMKLSVEEASPGNEAGVMNSGFWGMAIRPNTAYDGSFYAKAEGSASEEVTVRLVSDITGRVVASKAIPTLTRSWQRYAFTLTTGSIAPSSANHLEISVKHAGKLWLSLVSLFPPTYKERPNGNRKDLMNLLAEMHPTFLRFPGGNYLEGEKIKDRYDWKMTLGPIVARPTHMGPWGYRSSDGMGLLEFLEWCEDLHLEPVLAVYAGYSLGQEHVTPGADLSPYVEDALDEIEYVTGDTSTPWGARRAMDGHPQPFVLRYVEIGNEDSHDESGSYATRYPQFHLAIRKKYPSLQLIATMPVSNPVPDMMDDHFYRSADEFFKDVHHYDSANRKGPKIFVGEWATREGSSTTDFGAALGDAAWMTGMERNSDVVVMAAYAPLLVNVNPGGMQWRCNLIGYDALTSYGAPSYYAQAMFAGHLGDQILESSLSTTSPRLFDSVTMDSKTHHLFVKLVNASSMPQTIHIELRHLNHVASKGTLTMLSGTTMQETNSITEPTRVVPVTVKIPTASSFTRTMPKYSIQVIDVKLN